MNTLNVATRVLSFIPLATSAGAVPHCWDEEAVRERDPSFDLLAASADTDDDCGADPVTLSEADAMVWRQMVTARPALMCLRPW